MCFQPFINFADILAIRVVFTKTSCWLSKYPYPSPISMWIFHHYDVAWWNTPLSQVYWYNTSPLNYKYHNSILLRTSSSTSPNHIILIQIPLQPIFDWRTCVKATCYIQTHPLSVLLILHMHPRSCYASHTPTWVVLLAIYPIEQRWPNTHAHSSLLINHPPILLPLPLSWP